MKFTYTLILALLFQVSLIFSQESNFVPNQILIQLDKGIKIETFLNSLSNSEKNNIKLNKIVNESLGIYLFEVAIEQNDLLTNLNNNRFVKTAQHNHILKYRNNTPNDPNFSNQWQWINTGQNQGTADADVDAELAWDITTGGLTATSDTIVVAIIDDGTDLNHSDLIANHWVNSKEIPDNQIDDDANGYIDDYNGWNVLTHNDIVNGGAHGVEVEGMIGARGNNGIGVTGINWRVKSLPIVINANFLTEDVVIEAYSYALTMRTLYNNTNGAKGAYIVVTNSSWGIDNAFAVDFPIWCEFYNTLGEAGILSVAATSNANFNVDVSGDMPSTCNSPYLIVVTASDKNDVRNSSAYGLENVDLAAPGQSIYTTLPNNNYASASGTSFASPVVAGMVALAYSAPCVNIPNLSDFNPSSAALLIKDYILQNVDVKQNLLNTLSTGGRANAFKMLQDLMGDCTSCAAPLSIQTTNITTSSATIDWFETNNTSKSNLRWRKLGTTTWTDISQLNPPYIISNLEACSTYELQLQTICTNNQTSQYSSIITFTTDGCCVPPTTLNGNANSETSISVHWDAVTAANNYVLNYRVINNGSWLQLTGNDTLVAINNLQPCTDYEFRVQTVCDTGTTAPTQIVVIRTLGCGSCIDNSYCSISGDSGLEWIEDFQISGNDFLTQNDGGYALFENTNITLNKGEVIHYSIVPGFQGTSYFERLYMWIDLNHDGIFSNNEERVYYNEAGSNVGINESFVLSNSALNGTTRLRVVLAYALNTVTPDGACGSFTYGESEDYCVYIQGQSSGCGLVQNIDTIHISTTSITLKWADNLDASAYDLRYRKVGTTDWTFLNLGKVTAKTILNLEINTNYEFQLRSVCGSDISNYSSSFFASTYLVDAIQETNKSVINFAIMQNPTTNQISIKSFSTLQKPSTIAIYDVFGNELLNKVQENWYQNEVKNIDVTNLSVGTYFVKINDGSTVSNVFKVIKFE
ncbi:MAG: S8 family serine peptidase [Saprospiraceae bacterium]|nr:S8 family serine peptidase [Saprospiraceae bacterium]